MSPNVDILGGLAERWWACVFQATWQASLVAIVLLAVVWSWRRLSSPLRYALLLVVLVKFLMPPMLTAPTGVFSRLGPIAGGPALWNGQRLTEWELDHPTNSPSSPPGQIRSKPGQAPADGNLPTQAAPVPADRVLRSGAPTTPSVAHRTATRQVPWRSWLMLLHGLGCLAVAAWVLGHWNRLARLCRAAEQVASGPLHNELARLSQKLGLGRRVRLLTARGAPAPMAFGLVRPTVLIPAATVEELAPEELSAILAHELAHHRRWDSWVNCLQIAVSVVWWFNPLVWVLNRAIRSTREDCCDDLILHGRLTTRGVYGESLLGLARLLARRPALRRMPRFAHSMHPLRRRLIRVMDRSVPRAAGLSLAGYLAVLILAALVLPGVSMRAGEPDPAEQGASGPPATADAGQQPAAAPTVTRAGTVTDPDGNPLPGVRVRSYVIVSHQREPIFDEAHTVTDDQGRFELAGLRRWGPFDYSASPDEWPGSRWLVFQHPEFAVAAFYERLTGAGRPRFDPDRIDVRLLKEASFSGIVTDEQGRPVPGAIVSARVRERRERDGRLERGETFHSSLWNRDPITTDAEGRFVIEKLPVLSMLGIRVEHPRYAVYDSWNEPQDDKPRLRGYPFYAGDQDQQVKLSPGAKIEGRLLRDGKPLHQQGVRIVAEDITGSLRDLPWAFTDAEGQYTLTGLPNGVYALCAEPWLLNHAGLAPLPVLEVRAKAGPPTQAVALVCTEPKALTGRVTDSKDGRPLKGLDVYAHACPDFKVFLGYAETDEEGRYRLSLPPGDCVIRTAQWRDGRLEQVTKDVSIPSEGALAEVDFAIAGRPEYPGRLIDEAGRPVAGTVVIRGLLMEPIDTAEDGTFRMPEPWDHRVDTGRYCGHALSREGKLGVSFWWIPGGAEQPLELVLQPLATVRGRVVDRHGDPVPDAQAWIGIWGPPHGGYSGSYPENPRDREMRPDGSFEFRNVPVPQDSVLGLQIRWVVHPTGSEAKWEYEAEVELKDLEPGEILDLGDVALRER